MKPHILGRALSLVRAPEGVGGETFFQKHIASSVKSSPLRHVVPGKDQDVIAVETVDDLVALVQSGALEIHVRGSRLDSLETCDRIVFDLDPGEGVEWKAIVAAAREIRERLHAIKLASFVKLSGGKGIHVVLPIADADWDTAKLFAQRTAAAMAADSPKLYLAKMTKSLRKGRIFIDYFRNSREATSIAAIEMQEIKDVIDKAIGSPVPQIGLQQREIADAAVVFDDDFTIEESRSGRKLADGLGDRLEPVRPILPLSRQKLNVSMIEPRFHAIAVELDLMQPSVSGRHLVAKRGEAERHEIRQCQSSLC